MATITATAAQTGVSPKGLRVGLVAVSSIYSLGASLSVGDVIQMVKVPKGANVIFVGVSNGSGQGVVNVGDGVLANRYINSYLTSATSAFTTINTLLVPYTYSTDDTIDITVTLVSTGIGTGGFNLTAIFSMDVGPT